MVIQSLCDLRFFVDEYTYFRKIQTIPLRNYVG